MTEPTASRPDGGVLAVWDENGNGPEPIDRGASGSSATFDGTPMDDQAARAFTPDGAAPALGGHDRIVRLCRLRPPRVPKRLAGHAFKAACPLEFAPRHLAQPSHHSNTIRLSDYLDPGPTSAGLSREYNSI